MGEEAESEVHLSVREGGGGGGGECVSNFSFGFGENFHQFSFYVWGGGGGGGGGGGEVNYYSKLYQIYETIYNDHCYFGVKGGMTAVFGTIVIDDLTVTL